jgi:hypothetical protein
LTLSRDRLDGLAPAGRAPATPSPTVFIRQQISEMTAL